MANWEQLNFQDRTSPLIEQLIFLHDHIIRILILIITLVFYIFLIIIKNKQIFTKINENHSLEVVWTFLPGIILLLIAFPSLRLLYTSEETKNTPIFIKTIGHQWYWSYEYSNFQEIEFDSFIAPLDNKSNFRLLDTDQHLVLPTNLSTQIFISSTDVLHSWTVPNLGVKADSSPGRLNITSFVARKPGLFFGQCSEICGTNHRFIPITLQLSNFKIFSQWLKSIIFIKSWKHWTFNSK